MINNSLFHGKNLKKNSVKTFKLTLFCELTFKIFMLPLRRKTCNFLLVRSPEKLHGQQVCGGREG